MEPWLDYLVPMQSPFASACMVWDWYRQLQ